MSVAAFAAVEIVPEVSVATLIVAVPVTFMLVNWFCTTLPDASSNTAFSDGYVTNTSLVPAAKSIAPPPVDESRIVSRLSVVPEAVYVPIPTSH